MTQRINAKHQDHPDTSKNKATSVQTTSVHFFVLDSDLNITAISTQTASVLGYARTDLVGISLGQLLIKNQFRWLRGVLHTETEHEPVVTTLQFIGREGYIEQFHCTIAGMSKDDERTYVVLGEHVAVPAPAASKMASDKIVWVRGLEAFYSIRKLLNEVETDEALTAASVILNRTMSHPKFARSRIVLYGREYAALPVPGDATAPRIAAELSIGEDAKGVIEIFYTDKDLEFLLQESQWLTEISTTISTFLERKEIAQRFQETATQLQTLFKAISDLVFMIDTEFNVRMINKDIMADGKKCYDLLHGLSEPCNNCLAYKVMHTRESTRAEQTGEHKVSRYSLYPVFDKGGEVTGVLAMIKDITKEKDLQQQLIQSDRLASLGQLVSGIAHEINNPNTFIRGNMAIIAEAMDGILPVLDEYASQHPDFQIARLPYGFFRENIKVLISDMQHGTDRIMNIVADLRKFARKDEGLLNEDVNINKIIKSSLRLVHNQIKRTARVSLDLADTLPEIRGNIQKLEQVIVNVIINASHAIEEARLEKTGNIALRTFLDAGKNIHIHVKDDGTGMTPEVKKKIFDPFFTTKRTRQGTGLGLSIAYGIIEEHNGTISVDTWPGKGSEFKIVLPTRVSYRKAVRRSRDEAAELDHKYSLRDIGVTNA